MTNIVAIITARGGSKSILDKNMVDLGGKPLLAWTIDAAQQAKKITDVVVSSDSREILEYANSMGTVAIQRPSCFAQDHSRSVEAVVHALECLKMLTGTGVLLQPTSPFRSGLHVDNALECYFRGCANSLISGYVPTEHPLKSFSFQECSNCIVPSFSIDHSFKPRQGLPKAFYANGAIYVFNIELLISKNSLYIDPCIGFEMNEFESLDIDSHADLQMARSRLSACSKQ